jgi:hypothetical protein
VPEYTSCVKPHEYVEPILPRDLLGKAFMVLFTSLPLLKATCDYMLRGKLVCLVRAEDAPFSFTDRCAIGRVTNFETVDDKAFPETLDNDFSINLLLAPWDLRDFTLGSKWENYNKVANDPTPGSQGDLIKEQPGMPIPREPSEGKRYGGYFKTYPDRSYPSYEPYTERGGGDPFDVPVLHCEIEGDRIFLVCSTLDRLSSIIPGYGSFCRKNWFTRFLCKVAAWLFTPIIAPFIIKAWDDGSNDNRDFQGAGSLKAGDYVVIVGRWVYDAGHGGYNELHPVKSIQKISREMYESEGYWKLHDKWCDQYKKTPPTRSVFNPPGKIVSPPPRHAKNMTSEQLNVYNNQLQPENRWYLHPLLDGCESEEGPPPIR